MTENENASDSINLQLQTEMGIPRWVYVSAMFIVILLLLILNFKHDYFSAIFALLSVVILLYTFQNQQIEFLTKRLNELDKSSNSN